jgi:hypothetical protein
MATMKKRTPATAFPNACLDMTRAYTRKQQLLKDGPTIFQARVCSYAMVETEPCGCPFCYRLLRRAQRSVWHNRKDAGLRGAFTHAARRPSEIRAGGTSQRLLGLADDVVDELISLHAADRPRSSTA